MERRSKEGLSKNPKPKADTFTRVAPLALCTVSLLLWLLGRYLPNRVPVWKDPAEYPPRRGVQLNSLSDVRGSGLAVSTSGTVWRIYAPNAIAMRDGNGTPIMVCFDWRNSESLRSLPLKQGQRITVWAIVNDPIAPGEHYALFPAIPEADLTASQDLPSFYAYHIDRN